MKSGLLNKTIVIVFSILFLIAVAVGIFAYKKYFNNTTPLVSEGVNYKTLTEEQKINILEDLSKTSVIKDAIPDAKKEAILERLSKTATTASNVSYEEKLKILNGLSN